MRSPGPRFGWQGEWDGPESPPLLLQPVRSTPHREKEGRCLSLSPGSPEGNRQGRQAHSVLCQSQVPVQSSLCRPW